MVMIKRILNSFVFWGAWILIPFIMEVVPAIGSFILLIRRRFRKYPKAAGNFYPEISIIVPVYNSEDTLYNCIRSISESTYPSNKINVFLVNNQGQDDSFGQFARCQNEFPELRMQWLNAKQGKSRALNLALYNSDGKYIINIDSDGMLEPHALCNLVDRFEARTDLNCMTGSILTNPEDIKKYRSFWGRLLRKLEFMEYAQAFLAGRSYASETNSVYTLSGAFSAFRKSTILKSRLYNTDTICEDTQLTFQMRQIFGERVEVCENALFLVDPIEDFNKLYTQRQRWQRGSLEVAKLFMDKDFRLSSIFKNVNVKTLLYDHTFAFPRMIWYLAMLFLLFMHYSGKVLVISTAIIFAMYIVIGYFYFFTVKYYLKAAPDLRKFYVKNWPGIIILPFFNLVVFFIRLAGIINSIGTDSAWRTRSLSDEKSDFVKIIKTDVEKYNNLYDKIRRIVNNDNEEDSVTLKKSGLWYVLAGIILTVSTLLFATVLWVSGTYKVNINDILATFAGDIHGTGSDVIKAVIKGCVLPGIIVLILFISIYIINKLIFKNERFQKLINVIVYTLCVVLPVISVLLLNSSYNVFAYYQSKQEQSKIYEEYYVDPSEVSIVSNDKPKNLILIYLESMEVSYADVDNGGFQDINYMPNLTNLAYNNISFSNNDKLGGFHTLGGFGYTISSIFSTFSGIPYKVTFEEGGTYDDVVCLGDVLKSNGYNQIFMCGSESQFAKRADFFYAHGYDKVFDVFSAREEGYIPQDYYEWWGFEDRKLFDIAKDKLTDLSYEEEPFNLTLLTVDTHPIGGYICPLCKDTYPVKTANVVACTDSLVMDFVFWCQQQDFYKDTVIVMVADHPRMDTFLVDNLNYYDRTAYNCFINADESAYNSNTKYQFREYTFFDMYPTLLASLGFEIEGNKLGLGVNLFSEEKTLAEKKSITWLETECNKESDYYNMRFISGF